MDDQQPPQRKWFRKTRERIAEFEKTHDNFRAVVEHVDEHKETYIVGACCLVGGYIFRGHAPEIKQIVKCKQIGYKSTQIMHTIVMPAKGDPGDVVQNLRTLETYSSKGELARALGVARPVVSKYFSGELPDLLGDQFVVIGKAGHPLAFA